MEQYIDTIQEIWKSRDKLGNLDTQTKDAKDFIDDVINKLDQGLIRVSEYHDAKWVVNSWVKQAILLHFQLNQSKIYSDNITHWYDKIEPKFRNADTKSFEISEVRAVPGAFVRKGAYIGRKVVLMPCFVNIGAYIDEGTMIDTWATIGSCAQIGKNCHISGGAGIGGVLEPIQNQPVIIEDQCFIGARSEIVEGVIVETGAVIGMGVFIGASTKIVDRVSGEITYGRVPPYSVVVSGVLPALDPTKPGLYCAVIIKQVDASTRSKTSINELLRG